LPRSPGSLQGDSKLILIAGGDGKGQDFSPLKDAVARSARALCSSAATRR